MCFHLRTKYNAIVSINIQCYVSALKQQLSINIEVYFIAFVDSSIRAPVSYKHGTIINLIVTLVLSIFMQQNIEDIHDETGQ